MAFIVSPIQDLGCPTVLLNKGLRTDITITDGYPFDPTISGNSITFSAYDEGEDITTQSVQFAICGASNLSFSYTGLIETQDSDLDILTITVTGIDVNFSYTRKSVQGTPESYESVTGSTDVDLDNDNPCGYLVEISFDSGDEFWNEGVFYDVSFSVT